MTLSKLIESEVADFFAGFGGPGEPDIQSGEAQRQLTIRLLSLLERRERDEQEITGWRALQNDNRDLREPLYLDGFNEPVGWNSDYAPVYAAPPAPVAQLPAVAKLKEIYSLFCTPTTGSDNAMTAIHKALIAAMIKHPSTIQASDDEGFNAEIKQPVSNDQLFGNSEQLEPVSQPYNLRDGLAAIRKLGPIDAEKIQAERDALNSPAVPDGWVMVPIDPTWDMLSANGCSKHHDGQECSHHENRKRIWRAMLAAAPKQESE